MNEDVFRQAAEVIKRAPLVVAVTGAGASVESGIPDFRSEGGLWTKFPPAEYATAEAFIDDPDRVWEMFYEIGETVLRAAPNAGHRALAKLEEYGKLQGIVTQNIDGLHQQAGNAVVIEYHGNINALGCSSCFRRRKMDLSFRVHGAPRCECGGYMKPSVILFGEPIPPQALIQSDTLARTCNVMIVVGTSAQVYPAAALPHAAKENGAFIIECNTEATGFTHTITDAFLQGPAGETLPRLIELVMSK